MAETCLFFLPLESVLSLTFTLSYTGQTRVGPVVRCCFKLARKESISERLVTTSLLLARNNNWNAGLFLFFQTEFAFRTDDDFSASTKLQNSFHSLFGIQISNSLQPLRFRMKAASLAADCSYSRAADTSVQESCVCVAFEDLIYFKNCSRKRMLI